MTKDDMLQSVSTEVTKSAPAVAGTIGVALTSSEILNICTVLYVLVQMFYLLRKWHREEKAADEKAGEKPNET